MWYLPVSSEVIEKSGVHVIYGNARQARPFLFFLKVRNIQLAFVARDGATVPLAVRVHLSSS